MAASLALRCDGSGIETDHSQLTGHSETVPLYEIGKVKMRWEKLSGTDHEMAVYRAKVLGGWMIFIRYIRYTPTEETGAFFYPDHKWDGTSLP